MGADGALYKVGGLWKKLGDQAIDMARRDLLRIVVVASEQDDVPLEYFNEEAGLLRVLKATTIHDAIGQLQEQFLPRRTIQQYESEQCQRLQILDKAVPISRHYQALPLLRTVKRERLLRARTERAGDKSQTREEWLKGLRNVDIVRWEEALREEQVSYAPVSLEQILQIFQGTQNQADSGIPRFVVLGPPGCGKTTFTQYLAWRAARNDLVIPGHSLIPARIRLSEWETWFTQITAPEHSLATYLATRYQDLPKAPTAEHWRRWLQRGEVLLLLDGLDEIEQKPAFLSALKATLTLFKTCPTVITCRTVSFDQHQSLCPDFAVFTLAGLDEAQQETFIRAFPANAPDSYDPEALLGQLRATLTLRPLAANPLLLSIMCYVADHAKSPLLPATRGELYKKALETLLTHARQRVDVRYPGEKPAIEEKLVIVQRAALYLFLREEQRLTFTGEELRQAFRRALIEEGYAEEAVAPWVNTFRMDFTQNSGILRGNTDQGFFFLHLTVHEFLAAAAIAHLVNDKGWDAVIELSDKHVDLLRLIERKAWDPR